MKDNDHTHDTGFPWWPGLVDYCPEKEETLLLDPETNQPQQYHVVFFDKVRPPPLKLQYTLEYLIQGQNVSRSWVYREDICKLTDVNHPPRRPAFKKETVRQRYNLAKVYSRAHIYNLAKGIFQSP